MHLMQGLQLSRFAPGLGFTLSLVLAACGGTSTGPGNASVPGAAPQPALASTAPVNTATVPIAGAAAEPQSTVQSASAAALPSTPVVQPVPAAAAAPIQGTPPPAAPIAEPPVAKQPVASLTIQVPQVESGAEDTQCVQIRLSNTAPLNIVSLHNKLSAGSHHFILTALNDPAAPEQPLTRCQGFGGAVTGAPLAITQAHDDHVQLPEGLGYYLKPGHVLHLEMHYINTTDKAMDISATTELFAAEPGVALQPAAVLLVGTADISVPAHSILETGPKFLQLPAGMDDVKFFAITGHTHSFGTNVSVSLASATQQPLMDLYAPTSFDWEAPESKPLTPHISVPQGGGFLLNCAWNNTSGAELTWGESARQEMCFFWGYYYPRKEVFSIVVDNIDQELLKRIAGTPPEPLPAP